MPGGAEQALRVGSLEQELTAAAEHFGLRDDRGANTVRRRRGHPLRDTLVASLKERQGIRIEEVHQGSSPASVMGRPRSREIDARNSPSCSLSASAPAWRMTRVRRSDRQRSQSSSASLRNRQSLPICFPGSTSPLASSVTMRSDTRRYCAASFTVNTPSGFWLRLMFVGLLRSDALRTMPHYNIRSAKECKASVTDHCSTQPATNRIAPSPSTRARAAGTRQVAGPDRDEPLAEFAWLGDDVLRCCGVRSRRCGGCDVVARSED